MSFALGRRTSPRSLPIRPHLFVVALLAERSGFFDVAAGPDRALFADAAFSRLAAHEAEIPRGRPEQQIDFTPSSGLRDGKSVRPAAVIFQLRRGPDRARVGQGLVSCRSRNGRTSIPNNFVEALDQLSEFLWRDTSHARAQPLGRESANLADFDPGSLR
jgi:hypothetical protein